MRPRWWQREPKQEPKLAIRDDLLEEGRTGQTFMVRDDWQQKGLGRHLVARLIEVARSRGIEAFTADVLIENTRMMHVFHQCAPGEVTSRMQDGSYHIRFSLVG